MKKRFSAFIVVLAAVFFSASCRSSDPYEWNGKYPPINETPYYKLSAKADYGDRGPVCRKIVTEVKLKRSFSERDYRLEIEFFKPDRISVTAFKLPDNVKAFEISGTPSEAKVGLFAKGEDYPGDPQTTARIILDDVNNVFTDVGKYNGLRSETVETLKENCVVTESYGKGWQEERIYAGSDLALVEKSFKHDNGAKWSVRYYEYADVEGQGRRPVKIVYDNLAEGYTLIFR